MFFFIFWGYLNWHHIFLQKQVASVNKQVALVVTKVWVGDFSLFDLMSNLPTYLARCAAIFCACFLRICSRRFSTLPNVASQCKHGPFLSCLYVQWNVNLLHNLNVLPHRKHRYFVPFSLSFPTTCVFRAPLNMNIRDPNSLRTRWWWDLVRWAFFWWSVSWDFRWNVLSHKPHFSCWFITSDVRVWDSEVLCDLVSVDRTISDVVTCNGERFHSKLNLLRMALPF